MDTTETTDKRDFNALVVLAMAQAGRTAMKPVVEKEILHYDIFHALDKDGLLKNLVFQGGTSLRLCRGASRFSEDLDFAGGKDFSAAQMEPIKQCIETHIGARYGLKVEVKPPKATARGQDGEHIMVAKWQISIETSPQQSDFPRQRINIEIANVPAYTRELMPLRLNYDFLLGYGAVLVNVESLNEIMADKVIAFPAATKYVRFRDIWDLAWLSQQGAKLDPALVKSKMVDYQIADFPALLQSAIARLPGVVASKGFMDQMLRFIDSDTIAATLDRPQFLEYLVNTVRALFVAMAMHLDGATAVDGVSEFRM